VACGALRSRRDRGQALVEICITFVVLVPLFLFVWLLADLQALQHTTIAATRQVALEAYYREPAQVEWITQAHFEPFSRLTESVSITVAPTAQPEVASVYEKLAFLTLEPALVVGSGEFDLARDAAVRVDSSVSLKPAALLPHWLDLPELILQESMTLMLDDWDASGPEQVRARTGAVSAASRLDDWKTLLEPVAWALSFVEPAFSRLCFGRIDSEIVPADRLPEHITRQSDLRVSPCR